MVLKAQLVCFTLFFFLTAKGFENQQYGPTQQGDILWSIAKKTRPDSSISLHQMLIALLKENPSAFSNPCNFNTLKVDQILNIPSFAQIQAIAQTKAVVEFKRQNDQWRTRTITCSSLLQTDASEATPVEETSSSSEATPSYQETVTTEATESITEEVNVDTIEVPTVPTVTQIEADDITANEAPVDSIETLEEQTPTVLSVEEMADILPEDQTEETASIETPPVVEEIAVAPIEETRAVIPNVVEQQETSKKVDFSIMTVGVAIFIALTILGLLAWLALREKADKSSLRQKTEQAMLSNHDDKKALN